MYSVLIYVHLAMPSPNYVYFYVIVYLIYSWTRLLNDIFKMVKFNFV